MRNYLKMKVMRWHDSQNNQLWAWGGDDEQLLEYVVRMEAYFFASVGNPNLTFTRTAPVDVWWKLDEISFGRLLNGTIFGAFENWLGTRLNNNEFPNNFFPGTDFYDMTKIKGEFAFGSDESPRKEWSDGA